MFSSRLSVFKSVRKKSTMPKPRTTRPFHTSLSTDNKKPRITIPPASDQLAHETQPATFMQAMQYASDAMFTYLQGVYLAYNTYKTNQEIKKILNAIYWKFDEMMDDVLLPTPLTADGLTNREALSRYSEFMALSESNIVLVDNRFKLLTTFDDNMFSPDVHKANVTKQLFVGSWHDEILSIKYSDLSNLKVPHIPVSSLLVRIKLKNKQKFVFLVRKDENNEIRNQLQRLGEMLDGNSIEVSKSKAVRLYNRWPYDWNEEWEMIPAVHDHYIKQSDPLFLQKFEQYISGLYKPGEELLILDIGAGKGRLAEKLIMLAQSSNIPLHYIMLEPEKYQCDIIEERVNRLRETYGEQFVCQVTIINSTMEDFSRLELGKSYFGKIDGIISSGGPLNEFIVDFFNGHYNLGIVNELLKEKGVLLASGLTPLHFTRKALQQIGFNIKNMSEKIDKEKGQTEHIQFYVAEKNGMNKAYCRTAFFQFKGDKITEIDVVEKNDLPENDTRLTCKSRFE